MSTGTAASSSGSSAEATGAEATGAEAEAGVWLVVKEVRALAQLSQHPAIVRFIGEQQQQA